MSLLSRASDGLVTNRSTLGKYQLVASLAQGGMAQVFLALVAGPAAVNKLMVLKVLKGEMLHGAEGSVELFWDEARLATRLTHPNIVQTYEVGEHSNHFFLAMEYLDGQVYRLLQNRTAKSRLPLQEELRILVEVARGLHYAHELADFKGTPMNVVHRDVSPQNVFITYEGQVKLIDFGIAKSSEAGHETRVGLIKGKLNFIAPEQLRGDDLDRRADVFSLGVMLWEAVAGTRFAGGPGTAEVTKMHARLKGEEPNIRTVRPDVPEELAVIIDRAIAVERDQRWPDAASFADSLEAYMDGLSQRPTAKSLAAHMRALFEKDRIELHKIIDQRVHAILDGSLDEMTHDLPTLPSAEETQTGSGMLGRSASYSAQRDARGSRPSGIQPIAKLESSSSRKKVGIALAGAALAVAIGAAALLRTDDQPAPLTVSPQPSSALAAAVSASNSAATSVTAPASTTEREGAAPATPASITLRVAVLPADAEAQLNIDGAAVKVPFSAAFPKSDALHRVEVVARGYRPIVKLVPFNQDQNLELTLQTFTEPGKHAGSSRTRAANAERASAPPPPAEEAQVARPEVHAPRQAEEKAQPIAPGADIKTTKSRIGHTQIDVLDPYAN